MAWPTRWPDGIVASELVTAAWLDDVSKSFTHLEEVAYVERTTDLTVSATTAATGQTVITSGSITYEAVPHVIEISAPRALTGAASNLIHSLWDGATQLGRIAQSGVSAGTVSGPVRAWHRVTPTAAAHEYIWKAWRDAANGTINAGTGGVDPAFCPAFIRVWRVAV